SGPLAPRAVCGIRSHSERTTLRRLPPGGNLRQQPLGVGERLLAPHRRVGQPVGREAQLGQRRLLLHPVLNEAGDRGPGGAAVPAAVFPGSAAVPAALATAGGGLRGLRRAPLLARGGAAGTATLPGRSREQ